MSPNLKQAQEVSEIGESNPSSSMSNTTKVLLITLNKKK